MITRLAAADAERLRGQPLTYPEVGGTRSRLPGGYQHLGLEKPLGRGSDQFERAAAALMGWQMHDRAGLRPVTSTAEVTAGEVAVLHLGWRRLVLPVPVRVVYVVAGEGKRGFAYGTLPGHPETGEESFLVEHRPDESVVLVITAFSNPARWFARLGGPVTRRVQQAMTARYASVLRGLTFQVLR